MTETWLLAAPWLGVALLATLLSIWLRVTTALSEIVVGRYPAVSDLVTY
jgi:glutathione-regulated potassium-efflux system ancillary protein KefC